MSPRLADLARASRAPAPSADPAPAEELCELCSEAIPAEHRHLLDLGTRQPLCVCRACALLFDREAAGSGHYRLIGDRRLALEGFELDDATWEELRIPVEMAYFFRHSGTGRVMAFYPSPMGPTESLLELDAWAAIEAANPVLAELDPDVEALLVNRTAGAREHWLVPIDDCYALVAVIRTRWKGLGGGTEVWEEIDRFFTRLRQRASVAQSTGPARKEATR